MTDQRPAAHWRNAVRRETRGIALALLMVAAMTVVTYGLVQYLDVRRGSVIYLLPVLLAGWHLGLVPALVAAAAGVLWSGYFFYSPFYTYFLARPAEILNLVLFMAVAVVTSHLANSMKRQTEIARKRENEMSDLYAFSRRLAAAPSAEEIYRAIEEHLANLVQRKAVLIGTSTGETTPDDAGLPETVRAAVRDNQRGASSSATVADSAGNVWLVRRVSQRTPDFGVIAIDLGNIPDRDIADVRQRVDDVLSDAAATLERLDVARAINDAKMRSETELLREALIGSVSHELRTPLSAILGAATVLRRSPAIEQNERLRSLAGVVRDEAERLNNDIQNLLDATRISYQQVRPQLEWIEPADIVNSALERRRRRLSEHKVALDMDSNLPFIYVDPVLVQQAFVQIVDNAAKYSPGGSTIHVSAKRNGRDLVLAVNDNGAGLTVDEKTQLGERFFRGRRLASTTSGSGLGLWIAKAFVAANGGRIQAMSSGANQGTTVSIYLPLAPDAPQPETGPDD
ncbi:MAG: two-component system, OmpR family, sensor histidine kinase KdpD [Alphaproteobacteria bacterium]|jgi:two-component system sensor histidine kinase KdpD|nr:two-component system, OmpR family, sensor histidine kinase KdpD [Alphaproteobacteria bacterium]MEA2987707.1 two-component system, OmpR family, sensor histidine kinase KdpD [Alphaproteobacteria bacterium]